MKQPLQSHAHLIASLVLLTVVLQPMCTGPAWAFTGGLTLILFCLVLIGVTEASIPFVYFQF